jgi:phosphate starvation-inducible protein PhoH and related proteins
VSSFPGSSTVRSCKLDLPQCHIELLFSGANAPARRLELAVRPYHLQILSQDGDVQLAGDELAVTLADKMIQRIRAALRNTVQADKAFFDDTANSVIQFALNHDLPLRLAGLRRLLRPMSLSQLAFITTILHGGRSLIFGVGPTGTGKTHLAIAAGLNLVAESRFKSMLISRPRLRMEGEALTPELRAETVYDEQLTPIEDVLRDLIGHEESRHLAEQGLIEIIPLGRMRGRTFNETFILIDEAQNMTVRKMRMAVTRLGRTSRMVITGDPSQDDLPAGETSGLSHLLDLVDGTELAYVHQFQKQEIIRNELVARIEELYSRQDHVNEQVI